MYKRIFRLILCSAFALLAGAALAQTPTENIATYTDHTLGYSIDYPAAWALEAAEHGPDGPGITLLVSGDPAQPGARPGDLLRVEIHALELEDGLSPQELAAAYLPAELEIEQIETPLALELFGTLPALRLRALTTGGPVALLLVELPEHNLLLLGYGSARDFDRVVGSLRPALTGNIRSYRDDVVGFAVDYPQGWTTEASEGVIARLVGETPAGQEARIDILPLSTEDVRTLDDLIAQQREMFSEQGQTTSEAEVLLPGGVYALRVEVSGQNGPLVVLFTEISGRILQVTGSGDLTLFDAVAASLRATP